MPIDLKYFVSLLTPSLQEIADRVGYYGEREIFISPLDDFILLNGKTLYTRNKLDDSLSWADFQDRAEAILRPEGFEMDKNVTDIASLIWDTRDVTANAE